MPWTAMSKRLVGILFRIHCLVNSCDEGRKLASPFHHATSFVLW